jgi:hypothetical protein
MAHIQYSELNDLEPLLEQVRALHKLVEKKPGIFYLKNQAFLHFHVSKDGRRYAHARGPGEWQELDAPKPFSAAKQKKFLGEVKKNYDAQA